MKALWTYIEEKNWKAERKYHVALLILSVLFALAGAVVWLIIRNWTLAGWQWLFCFAGYAVVLSWLVVFFYSCRHEFTSRKAV